MEDNQIILTQNEHLEILEEFKVWSGPFLVRILEESSDGPIPLGSGGLLEYKERYFVITNAHVIKNVKSLEKNIIIPYTINGKQTFKMSIISIKIDTPKDIAIIEINRSMQHNGSNHNFLPSTLIELDVEGYTEKSNMVFCHGYPSTSTFIHTSEKVIDAETLPYGTFIDKFDKDYHSIFAHIDVEGISEHGETIDIPEVAGMSGSFVYGYYLDEVPSYKCLGVLTNWYQEEKLLDIYPINEFIGFLEEKFFC